MATVYSLDLVRIELTSGLFFKIKESFRQYKLNQIESSLATLRGSFHCTSLRACLSCTVKASPTQDPEAWGWSTTAISIEFPGTGDE